MSKETEVDQSNNNDAVDSGANEAEQTGSVSNEEIEQELLEEEQISETEQLQQQVTEANDQVLRVQAEMQNVRRRVERDVENAHKYALDKFSADLLPVVDNLERALSSISADERYGMQACRADWSVYYLYTCQESYAKTFGISSQCFRQSGR